MKRFVLAILLVIMVIWLTGCTVVAGHRRGPARHVVVVAHPRPVVVRPVYPPRPNPHRHAPRPHPPRGRPMHP